MIKISRRELIQQITLFGMSLPIINGSLNIMVKGGKGSEEHHPVSSARPVCPHEAAPEVATFIDPTVTITGAEQITLGQRIYIAPFARLLAGEAAIYIGSETNVQDNVTIFSTCERDASTEQCIASLGLHQKSGVVIADQCVLAHGATVKGPAHIGIGKGNIPAFLSFGSEVDAAILERNTTVSPLARVGPGVRLRYGYVALPGKNITTQAEADNLSLGKVRLATESDIAFSETVIEVNRAFAQAYSRLFYDNPTNVQGINFNPAPTFFLLKRSLPKMQGMLTRLPRFRNRIIGAVYTADTFDQINHALGQRISLRADEGTPFYVGHIHLMRDDVIFHALEHTDLHIGNNVTYGEHVIVHGGSRQPGNEPTVIEDNVTLKNQSIIFRSHIGQGSTVGEKSAVINSVILPGTVIPDRVIYLNNTIFGEVEW
jgi:carbonic anhydrase/acetyltransferase-like protein (isoleucine patch superfamily)